MKIVSKFLQQKMVLSVLKQLSNLYSELEQFYRDVACQGHNQNAISFIALVLLCHLFGVIKFFQQHAIIIAPKGKKSM